MTKIPKDAKELKDVIFERCGLKVSILPNKVHGWSATPFSSITHRPSDKNQLDRLMTELRAKYQLKAE
jgi:hypothetical protein